MSQDYFTVGVIANTHGLRGEVKVVSRTDFPDKRFVKGSRLLVEAGQGTPLLSVTLGSARQHGTAYLVAFEGYDHIDQVERFKGSTLVVPRDQLVKLPEGEYFFHELVGCSVFDDEGSMLGTLVEVLTPGANDVYVVRTPEGRSILLPAIRDCIRRVDSASKRVDVHIMPGLLDL